MQTETIQSHVPLVVRGFSVNRLELSRLMVAATVSQQFCDLLLEDPELALYQGYRGEAFLFTEEERDLILSIRASSLPELADQLMRTCNEQLHLRVIEDPVQPADFLGL